MLIKRVLSIQAWIPNACAECAAFLRCPRTHSTLHFEGNNLVSEADGTRYPIHDDGIVSFVTDQQLGSSRVQSEHYDRNSAQYFTNLQYSHTEEYVSFLDDELRSVLDDQDLGVVAEPCCGAGEVTHVFAKQYKYLIGIDVSLSMLRFAVKNTKSHDALYVHGDATALPLADGSCDSVVMIGGVHHVPDRERLFREVHRVLKPGGRFLFREPLNDFWLWRLIRTVIYRLSPALDYNTENPIRYRETAPLLDKIGLEVVTWKPMGFAGFCLFMNSDVLVVNRLFRFLPGIRTLVRASTKFDRFITSKRMFRNVGLQVVCLARKSQEIT